MSRPSGFLCRVPGNLAKLSEAFQEPDARIRRGFTDVASDVEDIERRLVHVEGQLTNVRDLSLGLQRGQAPALPVEPAGFL
jgi:hypothetical protein